MPRVRGDRVGEVHERGPFAQGHAGGGLVHQEQLRLARERDGQLDPLHIAVGQFRTGPVGRLGHSDLVEQLQRPVAMASPGLGARSPRFSR